MVRWLGWFYFIGVFGAAARRARRVRQSKRWVWHAGGWVGGCSVGVVRGWLVGTGAGGELAGAA